MSRVSTTEWELVEKARRVAHRDQSVHLDLSLVSSLNEIHLSEFFVPEEGPRAVAEDGTRARSGRVLHLAHQPRVPDEPDEHLLHFQISHSLIKCTIRTITHSEKAVRLLLL